MEATPDPRPTPTGRTVLVVEDEIGLGRLITRVLGEEGYEPRLESRGDIAVEAALAHPPALVLLDVALPALTGLEVCARLRQGGFIAPILMLTARDALADRVAGLDAGADDYLVKPFAFEELLARMRALLRRHTQEPERLTIADLVIETGTRRAWRGGRELSLSALEFRLLEVLVRHAGWVLTRQQLLNHAWGYDVAPVSNVVDTYIHYLRRKIGDTHGSALIHTVRSVGYTVRGS
ncbi:MAG: response regulator transcription factor [Candidatus Dormibacteria bacterium]